MLEDKSVFSRVDASRGVVTLNATVLFAEGNTVAGANFDFAGPLTESVLLSNIANRFPGQTLEWDAERMKFTNNRDANRLLRRKYRKGWTLNG